MLFCIFFAIFTEIILILMFGWSWNFFMMLDWRGSGLCRKHLPTNLWRASIVSCSHSPPRGNESYPRIIRHHSRSSHIRTYLFLYILHLHDRRFLPCLLSTSEHHILISRRTLYRLLCLLDIYCVFHPRQLIN